MVRRYVPARKLPSSWRFGARYLPGSFLIGDNVRLYAVFFGCLWRYYLQAPDLETIEKYRSVLMPGEPLWLRERCP